MDISCHAFVRPARLAASMKDGGTMFNHELPMNCDSANKDIGLTCACLATRAATRFPARRCAITTTCISWDDSPDRHGGGRPTIGR
jgi:hypothetical protein